MKKQSLTLGLIFLAFCSWVASTNLLAQSAIEPTHLAGAISYQTVIRDSDGNILAEKEITLQLSIRFGAPDGEVVYSEHHEVLTNAFGLVNLNIGQGVAQYGTFSGISWGVAAHYLETAIDLNGDNDFQVMGVTQFLSVPYSFWAEKSGSLPDGADAGEILYWDGNQWLAIPPGEHDQLLRFCNGAPQWGPCRYNLLLAILPENSGTATGEGLYEAGAQVTILAEANQGWEFVNWTDENGEVVSADQSFLFLMPAADVMLTANFIEEEFFDCGEDFTDMRDGAVYSTVLIGDRCWIDRNLAYLPQVNAPSQFSFTEPHYYVYGYDGTNVDEAKATENYQIYGVLYNWTAALEACPARWHLPTDDEWKTLEGLVDSIYGVGDPIWNALAWRGYDSGKNLRTVSGWLGNGGGSDMYDFSALPGGYFTTDVGFSYVGLHGRWWSSSVFTSTSAWGRTLFASVKASNRYYHPRSHGISVRCLR
jgi:uncharacterized protein (TIGR02145 family)